MLVASHRGDWRTFPENSLPAIRSAIDKGVDIIEIDLKMTSDSVLILMHDASIDRTTTGRGRVCDITFDSICKVSLRAGQGAPTHWKVPTLEEALLLCKGRAVVNIDQGFQFYDRIHPLLERTGMLGQTLIKGRLAASEVESVFSAYSENCLFMPIINFGKKHHDEILRSYRQLPTPLLAYEVCWSKYTPKVKQFMQEVIAGGSKLWVNSLWPSQNGGLCDDAAIEGDPAAVYGKLVDMGATLIQTDRPELLISYLRSRGLHD
ncbi:MAG: glycerophosphodiester phosphodiesterase family protein [Alistipes senegalensis]|nr:glycerophosphodiester phosphodiesterase family protein [Alistipes senegalensis]